MAMPEPLPSWLPDRSAEVGSSDNDNDAEEYEAHTVMIPSAPQISAGPVLVLLEGPVHGHEFSVDRTTTTIGRSIGCHVTITDDKVGYEHARVIRHDGRYRLEVTAGAGGTFVNDERVTGPRPLTSGDIGQIGPARFRFEAVN
jgi:pSer/pThr/pTyr-binding forkhead associated (FHA) protein